MLLGRYDFYFSLPVGRCGGISFYGILRFSLHHCHPFISRGFKLGPIMFVHGICWRQFEPLEVYELSMLLNAEV